jgi:ubiquitin-conjugating enzyme E2 variant
MSETAPASHYGRGHRALEIISIAFVFSSLAWLAYRVWTTASTGRDWLWITLATFCGYLVADFLSGFVHWAGDTVGDESTPVFGNNFVRPFRYHHVDPEDITRHDFVETNGNNCIVVAPVLLMLVLIMPKTAGGWFFGAVVAASTAWFVFCTNQFHKWAHHPRPAPWVRGLQRAGLILSPEHHAIHHAAPQDKYYCITVGWMNPVLERVRFFRMLEAVIGRLAPRALRPDLRA